jgi:hypothetical protein
VKLPVPGAGLAYFALTFGAGFVLVLPLRGMSIGDYFATLDPVAGTAYYLMQVVMALMPLFVARR